MAWWIRPLEMADEHGQPTGTWRLTATSDEDGGGPYPLCECEHETMEGARDCETARRHAKNFTGG